MSRTTYILAFASGAATGAALSYLYAKRKYERIAQEEIKSVKATFSKCRQTRTYSEKNALCEAYASILQRNGYTNYSAISDRTEVGKDKTTQPYVISPEEFGEFDDYEKITLIYYADGIIADENEEIVDDADEIIGFESLNHFGEYENDSVFVRNDQKKCDYEILLDHSKFTDYARGERYCHHSMEGQ